MGLFGAIGTGVGAYFGGSAGAAAGGAIGGAVDGGIGQGYAETFASDQAEINRQFQERMANTAYQRATADMRAAGINPMLAFSNGGAMVPTGAMASVGDSRSALQSVDTQQFQAGVSAYKAPSEVAANTASAAGASALADVHRATVDKVKADTENAMSENQRIKSMVLNLEQERQNLIKMGYNLTETNNVLAVTAQKMKAEIPYLNSQTGLNSVNEALQQLELRSANTFDNIGRDYKQVAPIIDLLKHIFRPYGGHQ